MTVKSPDAACAKPVIVNYAKEIIRIAEFYVGVTEKGGPNKGAEVEKFQKAVDNKAMGESWCMAFVQYCVMKAAKNLGGKPVLFASEHCLTVWNKTPPLHRYVRPEVGRVVIWKKGSTAMGHTGIICRVIDENTFETIEGNTGPAKGDVTREGDGVYKKIRSIKGAGDMLVLGYLNPFEPMRFSKG